MQHLQTSRELGELASLPEHRSRWWVATSRIRSAQGDLDGALDALDEADRLEVLGFFPRVRPVAALRTRVWILQGRWNEALGWAREQRLSAHDNLSYLREYEHLTLARLLLAPAGRNPEGLGLLERLLVTAQTSGRTGSMIEILVLQALAHQMHGDLQIALVALERALTLAEPEGFIRVFVNEGPPMAALLEHAARRGITPGYVRQLRSAWGQGGAVKPVRRATFEALSERERDVLRRLQSELSGPQLARELGVSLNTLRTHTKSIYSKLGVGTRRAAVRRAEELGLT